VLQQTALRNQVSPSKPSPSAFLTCNSILAFLASVFFSTADLLGQNGTNNTANTNDSLGLTIGFGAANAVFSAIAYFLIEPVEVENPDRDSTLEEGSKFKLQRRLQGRRSLLLLSLSSGAVMLFILTFLLDLKESNPAKLPIIVIFIVLFTLCYSPGAGCVPFVYSSEVWPNEGRGMSRPPS
jgi:MFS family permease